MSQNFQLLLAEDSDDDFSLIKMVFEAYHWPFNIDRVVNGFQAWEYLLGKKPYDDRNRFRLPDLVLTDLRMPQWDGFELLKNIRARREFTDLPVVFMTTCEQHQDRGRALEMGANAYFLKELLLYPAPDIAPGLLSLINSRRRPIASPFKPDEHQLRVRHLT
jgi:CheY-like chemotaxis protein